MKYSLWLLTHITLFRDQVVSSTSVAFIPLDTNTVYIKHEKRITKIYVTVNSL